MHLLSLLLLVFALGCAPVVSHVASVVPDEPKDKPWPLRIAFTPLDTAVRGVPLARIDPRWVKASELSEDAIPRRFLHAGGTESMRNAGAVFSRYGDFNRDGVRDLALVGVYQSREQVGSFLLVLTEESGGRWHPIFLAEWPGVRNFAALADRGEEIRVLHCLQCDDVSLFDWDAARKTFVWRGPDGGGQPAGSPPRPTQP